MPTPEGAVKAKVSKLLKSTPQLWYDMPVPGGFGRSNLDYVGCHLGRFFTIETKAPGKKPSARQDTIIAAQRIAGAKVFVIDGDLTELQKWLSENEA